MAFAKRPSPVRPQNTAKTNPQPSPLASIFGKAHASQLPPNLSLREKLLLVQSSPNMAHAEKQKEIQKILKLLKDDEGIAQPLMPTLQPAQNQRSIPSHEYACSSSDAPLQTDPEEEYLTPKERERRERQRAENYSRCAKEISLMEEKLSAHRQEVHCLVDPEAPTQHCTARLTQAQDDHLNQSNLYKDEGSNLRDDPPSTMPAVDNEETVRFIMENVNFHPHESMLGVLL